MQAKFLRLREERNPGDDETGQPASLQEGFEAAGVQGAGTRGFSMEEMNLSPYLKEGIKRLTA